MLVRTGVPVFPQSPKASIVKGLPFLPPGGGPYFVAHMRSAKLCREKANELDELAQRHSGRLAEKYTDLAQQWRELAEHIEQYELRHK